MAGSSVSTLNYFFQLKERYVNHIYLQSLRCQCIPVAGEVISLAVTTAVNPVNEGGPESV